MSDQERKGTLYRFATIGACTRRGGRVTTASTSSLCGLGIACVDHVVTYADDSEAVIMDGAGFAAVPGERPAALVGSRLSNGDQIVETIWAQLDHGVFVSEGQGETVPGPCDADRTPLPIIAKLAGESWREDRNEGYTLGANPSAARTVGADSAPNRCDQQFALRGCDGQAIAGAYYTIHMPRDTLVHGVTDDAGRTARHTTNGAQRPALYLGRREA